MFLKVGNIKYCYVITLGLKKSLPLSPAMTTLLFQIQIVKHPFKTVKMVLIRTFNFSLISTFNCQLVCSHPSSEKENSRTAPCKSFGDSYHWCRLKPSCYPDQDWILDTNKALQAGCGAETHLNFVFVYILDIHTFQRQITSALIVC